MESLTSNPQVRVYLGLGSNMGNRESNLVQALNLLPQEVTVERVSPIYESEPVGYKDQPWFLNTVCSAHTRLSPPQLLAYVKHIEEQLGRMLSLRNAPRPIDVDILLYDDLTMETEELTIPHPRMMDRAFVLKPLVELNPNLVHPRSGKTVRQILSELKEPEKTRKRSWSPVYAEKMRFHR